MVEETYFFNEGQTVITVGGEEFQVYKRGPERAAQFGKLTAWLGTYALSGLLMANEAGVKSLIISHQGPKLDLPGSIERGIIDISRNYGGEIIYAQELMVIEI